MATENPVLCLAGQIAGENMSSTGSLTGYGSTGLYLIAKNNGSNNTVVHCNAAADRPLGIIQNDPASGAGCSVMSLGVSKVIAGSTLTAGDEYGPNSAGRAVPKNPTATGANFGDYVLGQVLVGAATGGLATVTVGNPYRV